MQSQGMAIAGFPSFDQDGGKCDFDNAPVQLCPCHFCGFTVHFERDGLSGFMDGAGENGLLTVASKLHDGAKAARSQFS